MNAIDDAKAEIKATRMRFRRAAVLLLASPAVMGAAAVFSIAFGAQLIYARERLPPIGGLSLLQLGLPSLDLGRAGEVIGEAGSAAVRQGGVDNVNAFLLEHAVLIPYLNGVGFAACLAFLIWTMWIQAQTYRGGINGLAHTTR